MLYKSFDFVSAVAVPMMFGLAAISLTLAPKYYGPGYDPVGPAMMIESIVILMIAWSNALGVQYLLPIHHQKQFTISVTVGAVVNIILNFPLIHFYGLNGAMWSTVLSEISVTLYQLIAVRGLLSYRTLFNSLWKYLVSGVVMFCQSLDEYTFERFLVDDGIRSYCWYYYLYHYDVSTKGTYCW